MDDAFGHWFAGLVDGEGCFFIARKKNNRPPLKRNIANPKQRSEYAFRPEFHLCLRADDGDVLLMAHAQLGFGRAYLKNAGHGQLAHTPMYALSVTKNEDLVKLVSILNKYPLRSKKAKDYEIWRRAVRIVTEERPEWSGGRGLRLGLLRDELVAMRPLNRLKIPATMPGDNATARRAIA